MSAYLTDEQVKLLLKPIHPQRVTRRPDNGMSHVEGYDIRAELNRVFGFGRWDAEVTEQVLLREKQVKTSKGGDAWNIVYRTRVRLTVRTPDGSPLSVQEATHVGESTVPSFGDAHGNAVTNSETYALRRCCINFGDQFGLSLYNKGSLQPVVRWTLVRPEAEPVDTDDVLEVHAEETEAVGSPEPGAAPAATRAPEPESDGAADHEWVTAFRARIADAEPDRIRQMKVEVMRAVSSKVITPDTGTELLALVKERATALEGAKDAAA